MSDGKKLIYDSSSDESLFDLDFLTAGKGPGIPLDADLMIGTSTDIVPEEPKKKKRGRPPKKKNEEAIVVDQMPQQQLSMLQTNQPYIDTYQQTNDMLHGAIMQIDMYNASVAQDLETIRNSKTLKNKYAYITDLTATGSSLIGTKITAIRELNKTITDSHNLEIKRMKDLIASQQANAQTDEKYIMDMYNAFIQTPIGTDYLAPSQMSFQSADSNLIPVGMAPAEMNGVLSPEQNRMRLENNPNIKTVMVLNANTGERFFDVIDITTGDSVPNVPRPDPMFLEDTTPYPNEGLARNTNLDITYPLVVIGDQNSTLY